LEVGLWGNLLAPPASNRYGIVTFKEYLLWFTPTKLLRISKRSWLLRSYCDGDVQKDESQIVFTSSQPAAQKLAIEEQGEDS